MRSIHVFGLEVMCAALAVTGCANEINSVACATGIVCPSGMQCAAAVPLCIADDCGNGVTDPGEECDDGNISDGDGCTASCRFETCGDGIVGPNEDCDTRGASVTCNVNCTSPVCGDGIVNPLYTAPAAPGPEQCDPPSEANGCSAYCRFERCGNGVTDPGEECDDGNNIKGDTCFECAIEKCGNARIDPGEGCDDGNVAGGDGCSADCNIEFCGDGRANDLTAHSHEDCDTAGNSATCNLNCTIPVCGDGIVNPLYTAPGAPGPEQCDPPALANGCSPDCRLERCGNGVTDLGEDCDDGNPTAGDGCFDCRWERCGNARLDPGEQCDDGNTASGDGCSGGSVAEGGCVFERCGDGITNDQTPRSHEDCDTAGNSATCNLNCTIPVCGDGIVNPLYTAPGAPGPEQCDPPSVANGCSLDCRIE